MAFDLSHVEDLIEVPSEVEAILISNALASEGIMSTLSGVNTASFRTEAPGGVNVMIRQVDVDLARQVLMNLRNKASETDWENVDVGEPE